MKSPFDLFDVSGSLSAERIPTPVASAVAAGLSFLRSWNRLARHSLFRSSNSVSLMNFSSLGVLHCICGAEHRSHELRDRRNFCRSCGCEVVPQDRALLEKPLTRREIRRMTRSLRDAALRASHLEVPPSVTTVEELHRYLDSKESAFGRHVSTPPAPVEQPQVH